MLVTTHSTGRPSAPAAAQTPATQAHFPDVDAVTPLLKRAINLLGYDPLWDGQPHSRFRLSQFREIRAAGFTAVRINLRAFPYMDVNNRLSPAWIERVNDVTNAAISEGLAVILDEHDHVDCRADNDPCADKLAAFWTQFAPRFAGMPPTVLFEIMNEPGGPWSPEMWNKHAARSLRLIRASNPRRAIIIGPACSNDFRCLDNLTLPDADRQIIVTFHYYVPLAFTHQGTPWNPLYSNKTGVSWGRSGDLRVLESDFEIVKEWGIAHHRPIFLGEFGAYEQAPRAERIAYIGAVARTAERHGFGWAIWQFQQNFALYDTKAKKWDAEALRALFPNDANPRSTN
nr:glycoside hydrolase family 5 protein [Novosphingobium fluoreni]